MVWIIVGCLTGIGLPLLAFACGFWHGEDKDLWGKLQEAERETMKARTESIMLRKRAEEAAAILEGRNVA